MKKNIIENIDYVKPDFIFTIQSSVSSMIMAAIINNHLNINLKKENVIFPDDQIFVDNQDYNIFILLKNFVNSQFYIKEIKNIDYILLVKCENISQEVADKWKKILKSDTDVNFVSLYDSITEKSLKLLSSLFIAL